jgi:hypothetical protein
MRADNMTAALFMLIAFIFTIADAAATEQADTGNEQAASTPDSELLEFIAEFEPVGGAWIDPMHFYDSFETDNQVKENDHE